MLGLTAINLAALAALLPSTLLAWRRPGPADLSFWAVLAVGFAGAALVLAVQLPAGWSAGLGQALWATIAATLLVFAVTVLLAKPAARLALLLMPYLLLLGLAATIVGARQIPSAAAGPALAWLDLHILVSVLTYALVTLAAVAGLAVLLQERALKRRQPTELTHMLPSVADCERLELRLMGLAELVLGLGLLTGMATEYMESGRLLAFDHKTVFSLAAFLAIGLLLGLRRSSGLRGRRAARLVLAAYLLLTLAYIGVKVVQQVIIGR
jgi:ABC-type uncharacterized transport system permease subunit